MTLSRMPASRRQSRISAERAEVISLHVMSSRSAICLLESLQSRLFSHRFSIIFHFFAVFSPAEFSSSFSYIFLCLRSSRYSSFLPPHAALRLFAGLFFIFAIISPILSYFFLTLSPSAARFSPLIFSAFDQYIMLFFITLTSLHFSQAEIICFDSLRRHISFSFQSARFLRFHLFHLSFFHYFLLLRLYLHAVSFTPDNTESATQSYRFTSLRGFFSL